MSLRILAHAKVNLSLEVLGRREDGYHEIVSVLQTIGLADTLSFEAGEALTLQCDVPGLGSPDDLVLKAAKVLQQATGTRRGATIHLGKRIPMAAGLGSGATDAAAALVGLDILWEMNLPRERLLELAAQVGSDVPFFLSGGTAFASGRGEKVSPLPPPPEKWIVLLKPGIEIANKTAEMYSRLDERDFSSGHHTESLVAHFGGGGGLDESLLYNVFDRVAFDSVPDLAHYRSRLLRVGVAGIHLAGAGPALFALVGGEADGRTCLAALEEQGLEAYLVLVVFRSDSI